MVWIGGFSYGKGFYNFRVDSSINVKGLNLYSFYEVSEDGKKEILCRISEMIRYLIHTKNKVYIHSVEYDNKINEIIDTFKDILNKADIKCDLYTGCINDMHKLKSFLYDNADVYNIDNKAEEYYIWLDKVIDDITINLLKIIGERLRQISSEDDKKCFSLTSISHGGRRVEHSKEVQQPELFQPGCIQRRQL